MKSVNVLRYPRERKVGSLELCSQEQIVTHVLFRTLIIAFSTVHTIYSQHVSLGRQGSTGSCFIISNFSDFLLLCRQLR